MVHVSSDSWVDQRWTWSIFVTCQMLHVGAADQSQLLHKPFSSNSCTKTQSAGGCAI